MTTSTPDLAVERAEVEMIVSRVGALSITTPEQYEDAALTLRDIKRRVSTLNELRMSMTRPLDESKRRIIEMFAPVLESLNDAEQAAKGAMLQWRDEQEEILVNERAALEAAASRAFEEGRETDALVALEDRDLVALKVPRAAGTSTQTRWSGEVVDIDALVMAVATGVLPMNLIKVNQSAVDALARATKQTITQHGIKFIETRSIAASAR